MTTEPSPLDGVQLTHELTAKGPGRPTAAIILALAGLVPPGAYTSMHLDHRADGFEWAATWDQDTHQAWEQRLPAGFKLPAATDPAGPAGLKLPDLEQPAADAPEPFMPDGRTKRCPMTGLPLRQLDAEPLQCRLPMGHSTLRNGTGHDYRPLTLRGGGPIVHEKDPCEMGSQ